MLINISFTGIFIVGAKRTPFGTFGGVFRNTSATELQTLAMTAALKEAGVAPTQVDSVVVGQVMSATQTDGIYTPRHAALKAGIPQDRPALGINRLCGSGFQSVVNSAQDILTGAANISLAGGVENMSQAPFTVRGVRFGTVLGSSHAFEDSLWSGLTDSYCGLPMGMTAEKLGAQFGITRDEVDNFALKSQQRWKTANDAGVFKSEIEPVTLTIKKKEVKVEVDEHPRPQTTIESLKKLPPVFKKEGLVTAGSASGISDGAGALVLASESAAKGLKPLARLVGWSYVGVDPSIMGIGPVPAIENLLKATNLTLNDIDLIEINEAFVAQTLSCAKALKLDAEKLNVNGGATALGHPLGASGSRITAHLVHELRRRGLKRGIGSACIGGGQGIALLIETV
ncbi:3-ketoacyl-CoA thiolase, mitochondrial-like isoform X1 [Zerene cesonia]|uniref:3-ketoacyl-CoA thiolase, mitochondrial-like isoform X1 n=1 Tax=Zerene cesonia TaxID=33412 RepID=UPI0018E4DB83|nr:3-ketoacyl-CoA thiolase, mitochondrial-like isoform X1 [Zerene cesonia]